MESSQSFTINTLWHWRIGLFTCQNWLQSSHITSGWQSEHLNWDWTLQMEHVKSFPVIQIGDKVLSVVYVTVCTFAWYFSACSARRPCSFHKLATPNSIHVNVHWQITHLLHHVVQWIVPVCSHSLSLVKQVKWTTGLSSEPQHLKGWWYTSVTLDNCAEI